MSDLKFVNIRGHRVLEENRGQAHYIARDGKAVSINGGYFDGLSDSDTVRWTIDPQRAAGKETEICEMLGLYEKPETMDDRLQALGKPYLDKLQQTGADFCRLRDHLCDTGYEQRSFESAGNKVNYYYSNSEKDLLLTCTITDRLDVEYFALYEMTQIDPDTFTEGK